jgi:hypothetical protein
MATVYMLPDPYFDAFVKLIHLRKVDLSCHRAAGLKLFKRNRILILGGMDCFYRRLEGTALAH